MLVRMWMTRDVFTVSPASPIAEAASEMARRRVRRLPIVEPGPHGGRLVGIVSLLDLARAFPPDASPMSVTAVERGPREPVGTIMTRAPLTIAPDAPLEEAARLFIEKRIGALPVVRDGQLVGIITESDVLRAMVEVIAGAVPTLRVTFDLGRVRDLVGLVGEAARRHAMDVVSILAFEHDGQRLGVVRMTVPASEAFIEELRRSGHAILSVVRSEPIRRR